MGDGFPFTRRRKAIEALVGTAPETGSAGADDTAKLKQRSFIDLVAAQEFGIVAKVAQEPVQAPESAFTAVDTAGKRLVQVSFWLQNPEAHGQKRLLGMLAVSGVFNTHQEEPVEIAGEF